MLKIQEIEIDGETYFLREPRIRDHLRAQKEMAQGGDAYALGMISGMLLDPNRQEVGEEFVRDLPLRIFNQIAAAMDEFLADPLVKNVESSTGSPSP
jgi:hypothetical protein